MKPYLAYKKQFKILFFTLSFLAVFYPVYAVNIADLQIKINQKDNDIAKLEQEIKAYQVELNNLGEQKNSLARSIKELDLTKKKLVADINVTQKKIDKTSFKIQSLSSDISRKQDSINNNLESIKLELRKTSEFERASIVETLLSKNNFTSTWNDVDNIITFREKLRSDIIKLKEIKGELEDTKKATVLVKDELVALKSRLADQQKIVIQNTKEKNKLLEQTKNSENNYQKLLKDRLAQRLAFEKELRDYESQLKYILDPSKLPSGGVLEWPLENIFITQLFGKTVDSKRLYASGTHNGVDFRASVGSPVLAMSDGTVLGVGDTDLTCYGASFGKFVFIKYDNGLASTFGHLSLIRVYEGYKVKRGEIVGYTGNTGHSTGPHLHVSLYASDAVRMESRDSVACSGHAYRLPVAPVNAYLDALYYLPKYQSNQIKISGVSTTD